MMRPATEPLGCKVTDAGALVSPRQPVREAQERTRSGLAQWSTVLHAAAPSAPRHPARHGFTGFGGAASDLVERHAPVAGRVDALRRVRSWRQRREVAAEVLRSQVGVRLPTDFGIRDALVTNDPKTRSYRLATARTA